MEEKNFVSQPPIQIELSEKEAEGIYSNFVMIIHSPSEFIFDFAKIMPGIPKAKVQARIIMTPSHAKLLLKALSDNIEKFEQRFGEIKIHEQEIKKIGFTPR
ncbi:MAG: DUF3467 domain-containing protein [Candidatus Hydrothermales bacterium]